MDLKRPVDSNSEPECQKRSKQQQPICDLLSAGAHLRDRLYSAASDLRKKVVRSEKQYTKSHEEYLKSLEQLGQEVLRTLDIQQPSSPPNGCWGSLPDTLNAYINPPDDKNYPELYEYDVACAAARLKISCRNVLRFASSSMRDLLDKLECSSSTTDKCPYNVDTERLEEFEKNFRRDDFFHDCRSAFYTFTDLLMYESGPEGGELFPNDDFEAEVTFKGPNSTSDPEKPSWGWTDLNLKPDDETRQKQRMSRDHCFTLKQVLKRGFKMTLLDFFVVKLAIKGTYSHVYTKSWKRGHWDRFCVGETSLEDYPEWLRAIVSKLWPLYYAKLAHVPILRRIEGQELDGVVLFKTTIEKFHGGTLENGAYAVVDD